MNHFREELTNPCCYFHPREVVVGVCASCLKERLLVLAAKQGHLNAAAASSSACHGYPFCRMPSKSKSKIISITIPNVFALGSFFLRPEPRRSTKAAAAAEEEEEDIPSLEDSFISIKFEDDGLASWDKKKKKKKKSTTTTTNNQKTTRECKRSSRSMVERAKPRSTLRWRKRIGHLLQVIRWRRSSKGGSSHSGLMVGKAEVAKGRRGWIRSLTRRRATE